MKDTKKKHRGARGYGGYDRRTLGDIEEYLSAEEIFTLVKTKTWNYKDDETRDLHIARDRALMAIDFVGAFRNNEPLKSLTKENFEDKGNWLVLHRGRISKRSKKLIAKSGAKVTIRTDISFPKFTHPLQPFTDLVLTYLDMLSSKEYLFDFKQRRHHQIVREVTGKWPHWLRSMGENWYGKNIFVNDGTNLAKFIGVVNVQSIMPYVGFDEASYLERMKAASQSDRK